MTTTARNTREDVIRAAGRLFAQHGFHGTSMRDLGRELGLEGSSLYSHIGGKAELLVEVIRSGASMFQGVADEVLAGDAPPPAQLAALIAGHVTVVVEHLDEARTFLNEARFLPEAERAEVVDMRSRYQAAYEKVIARGVESGTWRADIDPGLAAIFVLSLLNALDRWYRPDGTRSPAQISVDLFRFANEGMS